MNEVTRYDLDQYEGEWATMREDELGDYVLASDYDQLKADNEAYKKLHDWLKAENDGLYYRLGHSEACFRLELGNSEALRRQRDEARVVLDRVLTQVGRTVSDNLREQIDDWLQANGK